MEDKKNSDVTGRGNWKLRWRPRLIILFSLGILAYALFEAWIDPMLAGIIWGVILILVSISILRAVAIWKSKWLVKAENPKEVIELARESYLNTFIERMTLWGWGERKQFHKVYDERMIEVIKTLQAQGKEQFSSQTELTIHKSFGNLIIWSFTMLLFLMGAMLWFRYRVDHTEKIIAAALFMVSLSFLIAFISRISKRNKNIIQLNRHGVRIQGEHYAWSDLDIIDVEAGKHLIYQKRDGEKEVLELDGLSKSGQSIQEAILYFKQILNKETEENVQ